MKEKILAILYVRLSTYQICSDNDPIKITGMNAAAEEITAHVVKFIEWTASQIDFSYDEETRTWYEPYKDSELSTDDFYTYWFNNIHHA